MNRNTGNTKKLILVADGERNFLYSMEFILESAGYGVTVADDAKKVLQIILEADKSGRPFDLLITDVRMKGFTGLALLDTLKELNICMPTFVMTSYGDKNLVVELLRRGCCEYLDKPVDEAELVRRVRALINKKSNLKTRREV